MSLIGLFIFEIVSWIALNRTIPFTTPRALIALGTTSAAAVLSWLYVQMWNYSEQQPFFDLFPFLAFSLVNATLALSIAFISMTYDSRHQA